MGSQSRNNWVTEFNWTEHSLLHLDVMKIEMRKFTARNPGRSWILYFSMSCVLSHSVMSISLWPHGLQPTRLLCPWDSPGKNTGVSCHVLLQGSSQPRDQTQFCHIVGGFSTNTQFYLDTGPSGVVTVHFMQTLKRLLTYHQKLPCSCPNLLT